MGDDLQPCLARGRGKAWWGEVWQNLGRGCVRKGATDSAEDGCRGGLPRGRGLWQPCWDLTWPPRRGFLETGEGEGICYKRKLPSPATWRPLSPIQVSCTFLDATFLSLKLSNFTYSIHILNTFNTLAVRSCSFPIIFPLDNTGKCAFLYIPD